MSERPPARATRIEVAIDRGVFMISVAAELAEMHPQTLRMYEARGLIEPSRSPSRITSKVVCKFLLSAFSNR